MEMNKGNFAKAPPTFYKQATALLGSEFLAIIYPPSFRSRFDNLPEISPECPDRLTCELDYSVRDDLGFAVNLFFTERPLPNGIDLKLLIPKEAGILPSGLGTSVLVKMSVLTEGNKGQVFLERMIANIKLILKVEKSSTDIVEVDILKYQSDDKGAGEEL